MFTKTDALSKSIMNGVTCTCIFKSLIENTENNKLMKGKALRKHCLHEKTAASVLLKLFISSNE